MLDVEMARAAQGIVNDCLNVQPGEEVLVLADGKKERVARSLARASAGADANVITATMPLLDSHGNEPPETVAKAMATADVAFTCTTHAITHTRARLTAAKAGTRIGVLRSVTEEMMIHGGMSVNFEELRQRTEAVRDVLDATSNVHVTSDKGTDVSFSVEGCSAYSLDGYFHEDYGFATLPPGESPTHPAEGTANGMIVIDVSMDNLGQLDEPITLELEDGFVQSVYGGDQANKLQQIIEENDRNAGNLAEFAIGTNPEANLIGNLAEDKKLAGTIHFAVGDNESLGGTKKSDIHLDGVVRRPTVKLDGRVVIEDGELLEKQFE